VAIIIMSAWRALGLSRAITAVRMQTIPGELAGQPASSDATKFNTGSPGQPGLAGVVSDRGQPSSDHDPRIPAFAPVEDRRDIAGPLDATSTLVFQSRLRSGFRRQQEWRHTTQLSIVISSFVLIVSR